MKQRSFADAMAAGHRLFKADNLIAAERAFREAVRRAPDKIAAQASLGGVLLSMGRLDEGFRLYDRSRQTPGERPELPFPKWNGEGVAGKQFLIMSEEGLGDQIMYARFAKALQEQGAVVGWLCTPPLARLFRNSLGIMAQAAIGEVTLGSWDVWCPSSALPIHFGLTLDTIPPAPYLAMPPPRIIGGAKIGVVASGAKENPNNAYRSLPRDMEAELLRLPGAISLLPEDTGAGDLYDTAEIIAGLDHIITVDSAPAHLAGALGKPVSILLSTHMADWRWLRDRNDSPWYQTARLYRQSDPGNWRSALDRVKADVMGEG